MNGMEVGSGGWSVNRGGDCEGKESPIRRWRSTSFVLRNSLSYADRVAVDEEEEEEGAAADANDDGDGDEDSPSLEAQLVGVCRPLLEEGEEQNG